MPRQWTILYRRLKLMLIVVWYLFIGIAISSVTHRGLQEVILVDSPLLRYYKVQVIDGSPLGFLYPDTMESFNISLAEFKATSEPESIFAMIERMKIIISFLLILGLPIFGFITSRKLLRPPE
ncbi:hypothetical protein JYU19_02095 [bacterium AH-315-J21]|nr:hypothetical protein [bacterium AH-315-J21]